MDRRKFVAVGAGALAVTATSAAAEAVRGASKSTGEQVTLSGWISPASRGPGHYFVFGPDAHVRDPAAAHIDQWPRHLTLVLPSDAETMHAGKVTLRGRLYRGKMVDAATGHVAGAVLTEATLV